MRQRLDLMKDFFLEANPNPDRVGCPDEQTIRALAEDRLPPGHPARLHLASCSECFTEYRGFRGDWESARSQRRQILSRALAASLILACSGGVWEYLHLHSSNQAKVQLASAEPVVANVDLFTSGTVRGEGDAMNALSEVSLPAAVVKLSVTLPRFSQPGRYEVLVSRDRSGSDVVAEGTGDAIETAGKVTVAVTLDLRAARTGSYFLATVRGSDNGMYYYPVQISKGAR